MSVETVLPMTRSALAPYLHRYRAPAQLGIKINAYRDYEVAALAEAVSVPVLRDSPIECLMVGDSYFMTHLGHASTAFDDPGEQRRALDTLVELVTEVRTALDKEFPAHRRPFLLADMPDGTTVDTAVARDASARFLDAGADAVKIEIAGADELGCVDAVAGTGALTLAHLGYSPQRGTLGRYGDAVDGALALFRQARRVRDAGACGLIVEMVSEPVNQALTRPHRDGLPIWSVFSGRARWGGQSLNIWDAVVRPGRNARYFPPTAVIDRSEVAAAYTPELIADRTRELIQLTLAGWFPRTPRTSLTTREIAEIDDTDPWSSV
jgi:ketopantoate hydroxymethyltransferase